MIIHVPNKNTLIIDDFKFKCCIGKKGLNFNKKATPIKTMSITQARKPIYKTSQNSYKKYYNYLDMFKKIEELEKA